MQVVVLGIGVVGVTRTSTLGMGRLVGPCHMAPRSFSQM
jgi:hypothetical protein